MNIPSYVLLLLCVVSLVSCLKLVTVLPGPIYNGQTQVTLMNRDAITVVFGSPVIPLGADWGDSIPPQYVPFTLQGADVPGKVRWVTTSIARFDPDIDWPADLSFTLYFNPSLNYVDSSSTDTPPPPHVLLPPLSIGFTFVTDPFAFLISSITSERASIATNNTWNANTQCLMSDNSFSNLLEAPPDSVIQLISNSQMDFDVVSTSFIVRRLTTDGSNPVVPYNSSKCFGMSGRCINIVPNLSDDVDVQYSITFPANVKSSFYSGNTQNEVTQKFSGLCAFRFPFLTNPQLEYYQIAFYLRHGLLSPSDALTALSDAIKITPAIPFVLSLPYSWMLTLNASFIPETTYRLDVAPSSKVRDAFNLPLTQGSIQFQMKGSSVVLVSPQSGGFVVFERFDDDAPWAILSRNRNPSCSLPFITVTNIDSTNLFDALFRYADSMFYNTHPSPPLPGASTYNVSTLPTTAIDVTTFQPPFGSSGLWLEESVLSCGQTESRKGTRFVSRNNLTISVLEGSQDSLVWVTRTDTLGSGPVSGATVELYGVYLSRRGPSDVLKLVSSNIYTDENGVASIDTSSINFGLYTTTYVVVRWQGTIQVYPVSLYGPNTYSTYLWSIVTDKAFYGPGEEVYVKGYLRSCTGQSITVPSQGLVTFSVTWCDGGDTYSVTVPITSFGTFSVTLPVPLDATYRYTSVNVQYSPIVTSYFSVLISTPRLPTTTLDVQALSPFYKLSAGLQMMLKLGTYTGAPLEGNVEIQWNLKKSTVLPLGEEVPLITGIFYEPIVSSSSSSSDSTLSGILQTSVALEGSLFKLSLEELATPPSAPPAEGDTVEIVLNYYSPTKELVTHSLSFPVANSKLSLKLETTVDGPILPNTPFGVYASVNDLENGEVGGDVTVQLYSWDGVTKPSVDPLTGAPSLAGTKLSECRFFSVAGTKCGCTYPGFMLPDLGKYLLVATVKDSSNYVVSAFSNVGRTFEEWQQNPLSCFNDVQFSFDKMEYDPNAQVSLSFLNPYPKVLVLLRWGASPGSRVVVSNIEKQGASTVSFQISSECQLGCMVDVILVAPRRSDTTPSPFPVPTSILFDPLSPVVMSESLPLNVKPPTPPINIDLSYEKIIEPGQTLPLTISLTKGGQPVMADLAVFVVDKAVLDLKDNPIVYLNQTYRPSPDGVPSYLLTHTRASLSSFPGFLKALQILFRRYSADPWLDSLSWPLFPPTWQDIDPLDVPDDIFESYYKSGITLFPVSFPRPPWEKVYYLVEKLPMMSTMDGVGAGPNKLAPSPESSSDSSSAPSLSLPGTANLLRMDFKSTPLFVGQAQVGTDGKAYLTVDVPDNVGTFEIRAYAVDTDNAFGVQVGDFISKREFSLVAAAPRMVRFGDIFKSGVMVTPPTSFVGDAVVEVDRVCEFLELIDQPRQVVALQGKSTKVDYTFKAIATGTAPLVYKIGIQLPLSNLTQKWTIKDAVVIEHLIAGQQEPVMIATSMAISESTPTSEGYTLPDAVPYSGNLSVSAAVGRLPAIQQYVNFVFSIQVYESADSALSGVISYVALSKYGPFLSQSVYPLFQNSLNLLNKLTDSYYGLQWSLHYPYFQMYTCLRLQIQGLFIMTELRKMGSLDPDVVDQLQGFTQIWQDAMIREFVSQSMIAWRYQQRYSDFDTIALAYLATGTTTPWKFPSNTPLNVLSDFTLDRLMNSTDSLSSTGKAALALAFLRDNVQGSLSTLLLSELSNTIRVQGRTAYITEQHYQQPNFFATALALEAFTKQNSDSQLIEKLANFVAQENQVFPRFWYSTDEICHSVLGLAMYDEWKQNTRPNLHLQVISANLTFIDTTFSDPQQLPVQCNLFFEQVPDQGKVLFRANGLGEASLVFSARFVPATLNLDPIYRGIQVKRIIQQVDPITNEPKGPPITQASIGQRVVTTIELIVPDYSTSIVVMDPFPGALDPLDDSIYSTPPEPSFSYWWCRIFFSFSKEFRSDKVIFHGQNLFAGTHTLKYYSLVNTEGNFVLSPTLAYDTFQPELMGLSEGGTFNTTGFTVPPSSSQPYNRSTMCFPLNLRTVSQHLLSTFASGFDVTASPDVVEPTNTRGGSDQSNELALILGLCLGLGVPVVIGIALLLAYRKTRVATVKL